MVYKSPINAPSRGRSLLTGAAKLETILATEKRQGRASDSSSTMKPTHKDGDRSMRQPEDDSSRISAENQEHPSFERTSPLLMDLDEYEFWLTHDRTECSICQSRAVKFRNFGDYMAAQQGAYAAMPQDEKNELHQWEVENLHGDTVGTSDWPGWTKYIGLPPWSVKEPQPRRGRPKEKISAKLRKQVFELDAYRCRHCDSWEDLSVDHIIPESKGGPTKLHNLQTLCRSCNSRKGTR